MKQPKINDLKVNEKGTQAIRKAFSRAKKIKMTIHFDTDIFYKVKRLANDIGVPYQKLLNRIVKDALVEKKIKEDRSNLLKRKKA